MTKYPVLFTFRDTISGNRFLAEVVMQGRLLVIDERDGWWMYGVEPGGLAEGGKTPADALIALRQSYREVIFDFASESRTFKTFKANVEKFFADKCEELERDWQLAVQEVRRGNVIADALSGGNRPIPKMDASTKRTVKIRLLRIGEATPKDNQLDLPLAVAA